MAEIVQYYGTGRRKTAIARVFLRPGSGEYKVNGKTFDEYFVTPSQRIAAKRPLVSTDHSAAYICEHIKCGRVIGRDQRTLRRDALRRGHKVLIERLAVNLVFAAARTKKNASDRRFA